MIQVSVVIPCYNAERWIRETLASVYVQQHDDLEIIVVDDGSTDASAAIIAAEFPAVQLIRTPNGGPSRARNIGTAAAQGMYIQYLDADDRLAPGKLAAQIRCLKQTGAEVAYGDWQHLELQPDGSFAVTQVISNTITGDPEIALFTDFWCPPAAYLFHYKIVADVGGWNEGLPVIQDARFALDCALLGARFVYVAEVMAHYRVYGSNSLSRRNLNVFRRDCLRNAIEVEAWWRQEEGITAARCVALLSVYDMVARGSYAHDRETFETAYRALNRLKPGYIPSHPKPLVLLSQLVGYRQAEQLALYYRRFKAQWKLLGR